MCGINPVKQTGSNNFLPRISQVLDGMRKDDGPVMKKLPVEADVVEYLVKLGLIPGATQLIKARGDLSLGGYYYLLRGVEYTTRPGRQAQTVTFRIKDLRFFKCDQNGKLKQLPMLAPDEAILTADVCTMKIENQKNGWRGVCISHWTNGDDIFCPVRAMGHRYVHTRKMGGQGWKKLPISTYFDENGKKKFVSDNDIRVGLKTAAAVLGYPERGIPIERIDTHSLRIGGANALSLAGWSDRHIQKLGRWRGETFKEYIREQLSDFSDGMSKSMQKRFGFVNVEGGAYCDITTTVVGMDYNVAVSQGESAAAA